MKFTTTTAVALLSGLATADYYTSVLCTAPTVTVTVTESACNTYPGSSVTQAPAPTASKPPYITTANGQVTSCDYGSDSKSTVYVYPTGSSNYDATCAVYSSTTVISVVIVNINIVVNNAGQTTTITNTKTDVPTSTPAPPPPPATNTNPSYTNSSSTLVPGYYNGTSSSSFPTAYSSSLSQPASLTHSVSNSTSAIAASTGSVWTRNNRAARRGMN